jgi:oligopeptidase B
MKTIKLIGLVWVAFALVQCQKKAEQNESAVKPPVADKVAKELTGNRIDNYYWMKLSDEQKNATQKDEQTQKVVNYLTAENDYLKINLKQTEGLQKKVYDEIIGRVKQTDESVP